MSDFLRELGYDPLRYWLFAALTLLLWLASAAIPWDPHDRSYRRLNRPIMFGILLLIAMFAWRWPAIFHYKPVNPDEAQFLAGALTMLSRGSLWWVDPTTSGPLVVLPLALPGVPGFPVDFNSGRIIGLLLEWGTVLFGYMTLRHVHGDQNGRLLVTPLAGLMIFLVFWDFVPYCSELSPLFLCAAATWLCHTAFPPDNSSPCSWRLAVGGLVLGLLPFSKVQVLPLGAAIGLAAICRILLPSGDKPKNILLPLAWLLGGTILGFGAMLTGLWHSGEWSDVYQSYVVHNLHYAQARGLPWNESGYLLTYLTSFSWGFPSFHYGTLVLLALGFLGLRRFQWRPLLPAWLLCVAAYCAVLAPGRLYPHYLLFLSFPLALLAGLQFGYLLDARPPRHRVFWFAVLLSMGGADQLLERVGRHESLRNLIAVTHPRDDVTRFINQNKKTGDSLAVWGWRPEFYVETQLPQATREAHTEAQVNEHPQRDHFRARYLADLRAGEPAFFIDSVGPDDYQLKDPARQGHETFPELADYIALNYTLANTGGSFRLYLRQTADRAAR